jgi:hypothetical protein
MSCRSYTPIVWNQKLFPWFKFDFSLSRNMHKEKRLGGGLLKKKLTSLYRSCTILYSYLLPQTLKI